MTFRTRLPEAFVEKWKLPLTKEQATALHDAFKHSEKIVAQIPAGVEKHTNNYHLCYVFQYNSVQNPKFRSTIDYFLFPKNHLFELGAWFGGLWWQAD